MLQGAIEALKENTTAALKHSMTKKIKSSMTAIFMFSASACSTGILPPTKVH